MGQKAEPESLSQAGRYWWNHKDYTSISSHSKTSLTSVVSFEQDKIVWSTIINLTLLSITNWTF